MGDVRESTRKFALKVLTKLFRKPYNEYTEEFVELRDQQANDYVREQIHQAQNGLMVSKWGTTELGNVCSLLSDELHIPLKDICEGKVGYDRAGSVTWLVNNSGFFPNSVERRNFFPSFFPICNALTAFLKSILFPLFLIFMIDKSVPVQNPGHAFGVLKIKADIHNPVR